MNVLYVLSIHSITEVHGPETFIRWMDNLPDHVRAKLVVFSSDEETLKACDRIRIPTIMAPIQASPFTETLSILLRCGLVSYLTMHDLVVNIPPNEVKMFEKLGDQYRDELKASLKLMANSLNSESACHVHIRRIDGNDMSLIGCYRMDFLRDILSQKLEPSVYQALLVKERPTHIPSCYASKIEPSDPLCNWQPQG